MTESQASARVHTRLSGISATRALAQSRDRRLRKALATYVGPALYLDAYVKRARDVGHAYFLRSFVGYVERDASMDARQTGVAP